MSFTCNPPGGDEDCSPGCYSWGGCEQTGCYPADALALMLEEHETNHPHRGNACGQGNGCRYNEIILRPDAWVSNLPGTITAVFFPEGGDEEAARRIREDFTLAYGLDLFDVPLVELSFDNLKAPFSSLDPTQRAAVQPHNK